MQSILKSNEKTRRDFMSVTAKTLLGVGALGYANKAHAALGPNLGLPGRAGAAKHIIYLYMGGGMTHMDTFDPKPGHENQGPVKAIKTNVDGIRISEYLPSLANHADKMAIIRSMTSTAGAHDQGNYLMHTSYEVRNTIRHPGMGAWLLKFKGRLNPNLPGSVFIGGNSRINGGGGFFEPEFEPLAINDPNSGLKNSKIRGMDQDTFAHNLELANKFDQAFVERYNVKPVRAYTQMYDDAVRIMTVHAAKGLEFPITVLSGMTTKPYAINSNAVVWFQDTWTISNTSTPDSIFEDFIPIDEQMSDAERRRLLYVACTRAVDHLIVSLHRYPDSKPGEICCSAPAR